MHFVVVRQRRARGREIVEGFVCFMNFVKEFDVLFDFTF
jgi:hypothetical protein